MSHNKKYSLHRLYWGLVVAVLGIGLCTGCPNTPPDNTPETIQDLGTLPGYLESKANDINASDKVVGESPAFGYAFIWDASHGMRSVGTLGGIGSWANGINDNGQVVGVASATGGAHAFIWDTSHGLQDLGTLGGSNSWAKGINKSGQVVGVSNTATDNGSILLGHGHAFIWDATHGMQDLGTLGGSYSDAAAINASGQVVGGSTTTGDTETHAFVWDAAHGMQDLGTLGATYSFALGINSSGQVVGYSYVPGFAWHAFLWDSSHGMQDLGTLGGRCSVARDINTAGQIVGDSDTSGNTATHAIIWDSVNGMQDLGTLPGGTVSEAYGINDSGHVVGRSTMPSDTPPFYEDAHAVLWK